MFARMAYTINWFNIPALFYFISIELNKDIPALGIITSSFLIGVGLFQIPAGILSAKYDPRVIAICGMLITSIAAIVSAFLFDITHIAILRFFVGLGMAFFFGPSVILIIKSLPKGFEGLGMGLLNSSHALGGILGLFLWVIIADAIGWRMSIIIGGIIGIISSMSLRQSLFVSKFEEKINKITDSVDINKKISELNITPQKILKVLLNKSLLILGVTLLGFQIGSGLIWAFIVYYLADEKGMTANIAGLIGGLNQIIGFIFSPFIGKLYDIVKNSSRLLLLSGILSAFSIMAIGFTYSSIYLIIIPVIIAGFFLSWGFVIIYPKAKHVIKLEGEDPKLETLSVSYVNGISLLAAFWVPITFSNIASEFGYAMAWILGGFIMFLLVIPALRLKI